MNMESPIFSQLTLPISAQGSMCCTLPATNMGIKKKHPWIKKAVLESQILTQNYGGLRQRECLNRNENMPDQNVFLPGVKTNGQFTIPYSCPCLHFQPQRPSAAQPTAPPAGRPVTKQSPVPSVIWSFQKKAKKHNHEPHPPALKTKTKPHPFSGLILG